MLLGRRWGRIVLSTPIRATGPFCQQNGSDTFSLPFLSPWNEWTEGGYLEPDKDHGMGYLEALRTVFG